MSILERIKQVCFEIATFGKLGNLRFGGVIASLFAFPILLLGAIFYKISFLIYIWFFIIFLALATLVIFISLGKISDQYPSSIVLDKIIGIIFTFAYIPLRFKLFIFGFALFHVINFLRPRIFNVLGQKVDYLPVGLGVIAGDIISGLICNIFLRIVLWVAS